MSTVDPLAVLVSMLERKVKRLGDLQSLARTGSIHDGCRPLEELKDLSSDICQLVMVVFAMHRPEASGSDPETQTVDAERIERLFRASTDFPVDDAHAHMISRAVELSMTAGDFDLNDMRRKLDMLQEEVTKLHDVVDATRPGGLLPLVLRVGLATLAAAGMAPVVAPVAAFVFNDPVSRKVLEAALATFIGTATVEAGNAIMEHRKTQRISEYIQVRYEEPGMARSTPSPPEAFGYDTPKNCGGPSVGRISEYIQVRYEEPGMARSTPSPPEVFGYGTPKSCGGPSAGQHTQKIEILPEGP